MPEAFKYWLQLATDVGTRLREQRTDAILDVGGGDRQKPDHGKGELLLLQVGAERFAGRALLAPKVEDVVRDLKRDADLATVAVKRLDRLGFGAGVIERRVGRRRRSTRRFCRE